MTPESPPDTLGSFRLLRVVASTPMGIVYEAVDPEHGHPVALRVLPAGTVASADERERLRRATQAAAGLQHPNILAVHDCGWHDRTAFVVTALLEAETLAQYLARAGRLPAFHAVALAAQLLSALDAAHGQGMVHGAIHPDLLLVSRTGRLIVDGFGWAAAIKADASRVADPRADVDAAAAVAHALLTDTLPSRANDAARGRTGLEAVFERALSGDPGAHYRSAAELSAALLSAIGPPLWDRSSLPTRPAQVVATPEPPRIVEMVPEPRRPAVPRRRHPLGLAVAAGCAAFTLGLAILWIAEPPAPARAPLAEADAATTAHEPPRDVAMASTLAPPALVAASTPLAPSPAPIEAPGASQVRQTESSPQRDIAQDTGTRHPADAKPHVDENNGVARHAQNMARAADHKTGARQAPRPRAPHGRHLQAARPDASCRRDLTIARQFCVALACATTEFRSHPMCVRMHAEQRARDRAAASLVGGP